MEASVIIPSYNDGAKLARCLDSLLGQSLPGGLEVVVALDGSTDGTEEMLQRGSGQAEACGRLGAWVKPGAWRELNLRIVSLEQNQGRSVARNRAIEQAEGDWLYFLDADLIVHPEWAARHRVSQKTAEQVSLGSMFYLMPEQQNLVNSLWQEDPLAEVERQRGLLRYQRYLETRGPYKFRKRDEMPARYFYTCNACVHVSLMREAGGFNERFRAWGGEDIDLGLKLGAAGAKMCYTEPALALHEQERSFARHCMNLEVMGREILPLLLKDHPEMRQALQLDRMAPAQGGAMGLLLRLMRRAGGQRLLLLLERLGGGLGFTEAIYDLCVYLHYAGGFWDGKEEKLEHGHADH